MGVLGERKRALHYLLQRCKSTPASCDPSLDVYAFGVYTGYSMKTVSGELVRGGVPYRKLWGFDSFEGLPNESRRSNRTAAYGARMAASNYAGSWRVGAWNAADQLGEHTLVGLTARLEAFIAPPTAIGWVAGYYSQTLTNALADRRGMRPALFVDIDVDLYSSTRTALEWLFASRLIVRGTIIAYDDIAAGGGYADGEGLAHQEAVLKYNVTAREIHNQCCYEILSYDGMPA